MQKWRVLDFQKSSERVSAKSGRIYAGERSVPLADVAVILTGVETVLHASLIDRAAAFGVPIVACDWRGVPTSVILPWSSNTRVCARQLAQVDLSEGRRKNAWKQIVKAKIGGQQANLPPGSPAEVRLKNIRSEVRSGDTSNAEAQAARIYWSAVFDEVGFLRDQDAGSGKNALLNYGYTILRGHVVRHLLCAGLWPTLGIQHRGRGNHFALADDLIEPFRPALDFVVKSLPIDASLQDRSIKQALVGVSNLRFSPDGSSIVSAIERLSQNYAMYVEGKGKKLAVPTWSGGE